MTEMDKDMTLAKSTIGASPSKTSRAKATPKRLTVQLSKSSPFKNPKEPTLRDPAIVRTWTGRGKVPKWTVDEDHAPSIFEFVGSALFNQIAHVRNGLPSTYVAEMSDALDMPRANFLDSLQLPRSTIEARIKKNTLLTPSEGDAVLRAAKALAKAQDVFEDRAMASAWLKRAVRSLGGVTPVSLMDTDSGFELVMSTLGRIEHGVVA